MSVAKAVMQKRGSGKMYLGDHHTHSYFHGASRCTNYTKAEYYRREWLVQWVVSASMTTVVPSREHGQVPLDIGLLPLVYDQVNVLDTHCALS
jgi:hypothetical protein